MYYLTRDDMFRGKNLPQWLKLYQDDFDNIILVYGRDKFEKVYNWVFRELGKLQWGQWWVVGKICPKEEDLHLFYFCIEMIYQSSLLCSLRFEDVKSDDGKIKETRIVVDAPPETIQKTASIFFSGRKYLLVDWYNKIKYSPDCCPDIDPQLFGFSSKLVCNNINQQDDDIQ